MLLGRPEGPEALLRLAEPELSRLEALLFARPDREGGSFALFGWRETAGAVVITLAELVPPQPGELAEEVDRVVARHPYLRRTACETDRHALAVGFIHSHPDGFAPVPSAADDELDGYLAAYLCDFAPDRPYVGLIASRVEGETAVSGRVRINGRWSEVTRVAAERRPIMRAWPGGERPPPAPPPPPRVERMTSAFGAEAFQRLQRSTVALIGAGGTGSAAIPILARAGVGRLIVVDGDHATISNLERLHGSNLADVERAVAKATIAKRSVSEYAPDVVVDAIVGRLPQAEVLDAVMSADVLLGCTDQHSSRLAVADAATRYLIPAIDCGGLIEGADGTVTGQLVQIVRFLAADPCPRCRGMISEMRVAQEALPREVRADAAAQVQLALAAGERPDPILTAVPQIDTVGYITTTAGTLAAGFAIGWLTGRFSAAFERLQLDLVSDCLGAVERPQIARADCVCRRVRGHADQASSAAPITPSPYWPPVRTG